jgi:hypothetical protein
MEEPLKPSELIRYFNSSICFDACLAEAVSLTMPVPQEQDLALDQF